MSIFSRGSTIILAMVVVLVMSRTTPAQGPNNNANSPSGVVQGAAAAHGKVGGADPVDFVANGRVTLYTLEGPKVTFDVTLLRKGSRAVQRIINQQPVGELKQGTDGTRSWESMSGFFTPAAQGRALHFIESQTVRSTQRLFNHQTEGLTLRDAGSNDPKTRVIEATDSQSKKTKYSIDAATSIVTRLEFVVGQAKDPFSQKLVDVTDEYVFSDYRKVQGVLTPFKIERLSNGNKTEEMVFTTVKYNTGLKDQDFHR